MNMQGPRFTPEITLGHVLTTVSFLVFGLGAFFLVKSDAYNWVFEAANENDNVGFR